MEQIKAHEGHYSLDINLIDLMVLIVKDWLWFALFCIAGAAFGTYVAFSIPKFYRSSIMLAPEEAQGALGGNVSSLASMVGLDMKIGTSDAIYPEIYPDVMHSTEFIVDLFSTPVSTLDGKLTTDYRTYLTRHQKTTWWGDGMKWLQRQLQNPAQQTSRAKGMPVDPTRLTMEEDIVARTVDKNVKCLVDKKTDVITISVDAQDPLVAKTVVDSATSRLQSYVTDYRTRKAKADLAYMDKIYEEAKNQYDAARTNYAAASTAHQDLVMETARSMVKALENDMQLKYAIFSQVAEQRQLAQANVQKMTPAFTVIKNSTVPVKHANRPKVLVMGVFLILAAVLRVIILVIKHRKRFITKH